MLRTFSSREKKLITLAGITLIVMCIWQPRIYHVYQYSMFPTITNDQRVLAIQDTFLHTIEYKKGDIIVFEFEGNKLAKRIIGVAGDLVEIDFGSVFVNEVEVQEDYVLFRNLLDEKKTCLVPKDHYFVMGDNRPYSLDSRRFGVVNKSRVVGKIVWW